MAVPTTKSQDKPIDPAKRAQQIRDALDKKRIKRTEITDETLAMLDGIVAQEAKKTA